MHLLAANLIPYNHELYSIKPKHVLTKLRYFKA